MKKFKTEITKSVVITVLNEPELLEIHRSAIDENATIDETVQYLAACIVDDTAYAGLIKLDPNNKLFTWEYSNDNDVVTTDKLK
jgi:hypothetical protein